MGVEEGIELVASRITDRLRDNDIAVSVIEYCAG